MLYSLLLALALATLPGSAPAQQPPTADTSASAGWTDGRMAAAREGTSGSFALAFAGGLPIGFFGLFALDDGDPPQMLGLGVGAGLVLGVVTAAPVRLPSMLAHSAATRGPAYERAFREGYRDRVRERRRSAALWGGLTGAATGFGALLWLLSIGLD